MLKEDVFEEVLVATEANVSSDYETERNKPMPNKLHAILQSGTLTLLNKQYQEQFDIFSELSLDTTPGSTPDLAIYPRAEKFVRKEITAKESEPPLTTIEIISPGQSVEELVNKIQDTYFPMGVKSAWLIEPSLKVLFILRPGAERLIFEKGMATDPATGIEISVDKIFERVV